MRLIKDIDHQRRLLRRQTFDCVTHIARRSIVSVAEACREK